MFNAITYFVIPKSFLERDLGYYLLIKDESMPSLSSMPESLVGSRFDHQSKPLGLKMQELLLDPSHPSIKVQMQIDQAAPGVQALLADKKLS
jgi:hypothetical protein